MKILDDYFKLQEEIYKYFGYNEDWVVFPLDDRREYYWYLELKKHGNPENKDYYESGYVYFAENKSYVEQKDGDDKDGFQDEIFHQRFLPQAVYRGKNYTMIIVDTQTDGNKFLAIYDNLKNII